MKEKKRKIIKKRVAVLLILLVCAIALFSVGGQSEPTDYAAAESQNDTTNADKAFCDSVRSTMGTMYKYKY